MRSVHWSAFAPSVEEASPGIRRASRCARRHSTETVVAPPYDRPVNPIFARQVLQLDPAMPLTADVVETAYQRELWARHPSRYPDAEGRAAAEAWAITLGQARETLLAPAAPGSAAGPMLAPGARRGLSGGAIAGIVAAGVVVLALLVGAGVAIGVGLPALTNAIAEDRSEAATEPAADSIEWYQSDETGFTFPAALEVYYDGRLTEECPDDYLEGCWQMAVYPDADCTSLEVTVVYTDDEDGWAIEETDTFRLHDVVEYERTPVVFGNDDYQFGWLDDLVCLDSAA